MRENNEAQMGRLVNTVFAVPGDFFQHGEERGRKRLPTNDLWVAWRQGATALSGEFEDEDDDEDEDDSRNA